MTIDFHLIWCLYSGCGNMCCHLDARDLCAAGTTALDRNGFILTFGEEAAMGMFNEVIVERRGI